MAYRKYRNESLAKSIRKLYLDEKTADVHFIFDTDECVPAHKNLLIATSKVFEAMFNGCWQEKENVRIIDASAKSFKEFLQFFYLDEVELTMKSIIDVMNLGQKYDIDECTVACSRFLEYNLTDDNVCFIYKLAILFDDNELKTICEMNISINTKKVFKSMKFLKCERNVLKNILTLDRLHCLETDVFNACIAWIKMVSKQHTLNKQTIHDYLGDAFYNIRFGSMQMNEFIKILVSNRDLFSIAEQNDIIQLISSQAYKSQYFNTKRRQITWDEMFPAPKIHCKRTCGLAFELEHNIGDTISTEFHINTTLLLRAIVCAEILQFLDWPSVLAEDLIGKLTIVETRGRQINNEVSAIVYSNDIRLQTNKYSIIMLTRPVIIRRGIKYKIQLDLKLPSKCCSLIYFKNDHVHIEPGIIVKFVNDIVKGDKQRGLIYGLQFSRY